MRYLMLVHVDESLDAGPDEVAPWVAEMDRRGIRQFGSRLRPVRDTTTVRVRDGEILLTDGPFTETKEQIGGFDILECKDLDEAIAVAAEHPGAKDGRIEVRPLWEE
ncbi:MAG TPA: YciI family protein [Jiangellaceae bacterium]